MLLQPLKSTLFPYTTLFRSFRKSGRPAREYPGPNPSGDRRCPGPDLPDLRTARSRQDLAALDRKSTRLNSSHSQISYAVFCLKKKRRKAPSPSTTTKL